MGSTQRTTTSTARGARRAIVAVIAVVGLGLTACSGSDDDDAATASLDEAAAAATIAPPADGDSTSFGVADAAGGGEARTEADPTTRQVPGEQQIAIEARASVQTDDVKATVDRVTTTAAARGGRIAAADIDYARPAGRDGTEPVDPEGSRATLVVAIPPAELAAVRDVLEEVGDVLAYDQLAEDVTEQLADLDTRITNQRASIERIRELYANAPDVDSIVRIEAELTNRETVLEQLLASQQNLAGRVALSTLTIDIAVTPEALEPVADDDPGLGDALAAGWSAFAGGVFAVVLALSAALPFLLTAITVLVAVLWVRSRVVRSRGVSRPPSGGGAVTEREPVAERQAQ